MAIATGSSPVGAQEMKGFCRNGLVFAERGWRDMALPQNFVTSTWIDYGQLKIIN